MAMTIARNHPGQFRVAAIGENKCSLASYSRRDFYKISLVNIGSPSQLQYGSLAIIDVDRPALVLTNPMVPQAWTVQEDRIPTQGYFCVFDEEFITANTQLSAMANRLFTGQQSPVYFPEASTQLYLTELFKRMREVADLDYAEKNDLYQSLLNLVFHEANQMRRTEHMSYNAISRLANTFVNLLGRQFPVDLPLQPIKLKSASDYAAQLAVHVNHLNTAVQKATGKSTTTHINEKILSEAKSLLSYTNYTIAEITDGLGFEYQSYFSRFFKRHTGITPTVFRKNFEKYQ